MADKTPSPDREIPPGHGTQAHPRRRQPVSSGLAAPSVEGVEDAAGAEARGTDQDVDAVTAAVIDPLCPDVR
ncbi:hypothetical protein [Saccharothrix syringae]|uniref:hypothetical protein n=1 Tax=Saccharothrix syringae TaxID=103733 RepID=UPI00147776AC|nr:hypothetical protein [Saccharothrix syringae]